MHAWPQGLKPRAHGLGAQARPNSRRSGSTNSQLPLQHSPSVEHGNVAAAHPRQWPPWQSLLAQSRPQSPQWAGSVPVSTQAPSQKARPAGQAQIPPWQVRPAVQCAFVQQSRQVPSPQSCLSAGQAQAPFWQVLPPSHSPLAQQLASGMQRWLQSFSPRGQGLAAQRSRWPGGASQMPLQQSPFTSHSAPAMVQSHAPFWQVPLTQSRAQPPQWAGSVRVSTQSPAQQVRPVSQTWPHDPQFASSVCGLMQVPPQSIRPLGQAHV